MICLETRLLLSPSGGLLNKFPAGQWNILIWGTLRGCSRARVAKDAIGPADCDIISWRGSNGYGWLFLNGGGDAAMR